MSATPWSPGSASLAPNGLGAEAYWAATLAGAAVSGRISRFDPTGYPVRLAGEVRGFDAAEYCAQPAHPADRPLDASWR